MWTLDEQSDLGHTVCKNDFKNHKQMTKQTTVVVIGSLRVKRKKKYSNTMTCKATLMEVKVTGKKK